MSRDIAGELSEEETSRLRQLMENHPGLQELRNQLEEEFASLEAQNGLAGLRQNFNLDVAKQVAEERDIENGPFEKRKMLPRWVSTAAAALLITAGAIFFWKSKSDKVHTDIPKGPGTYVKLVMPDGKEVNVSGARNQQIGALVLHNNNQQLTFSYGKDGKGGTATLHVPDGKDFSVKLSDGTEIQLNSGSTLSFPFTFPETIREITISGEAYLKVAKNAAKPFLVRLKPIEGQATEMPTVQVLGTEFNINTYDGGSIKVALLEGSVKMSMGKDILRLKPGFQAVLQKGRAIKAERFDAEEVLSWKDGILDFKGARLAEVFGEIPRWYGVKVSVDDSALNSKLFTGALNRKKPVTVFLEDLVYTHGINYFIKEGVVHLNQVTKQK